MNDERNEAMSEDFTVTQVIAELEHKAMLLGGQAGLARLMGISASHLSDVIRGKRDPGPAVLTFLHLERVVTYRRVRE